MKKNEYNKAVDECRNNSCYSCSCNSTDKCFKSILEKIIKDFPNRYFNDLSPIEQSKVSNIKFNKTEVDILDEAYENAKNASPGTKIKEIKLSIMDFERIRLDIEILDLLIKKKVDLHYADFCLSIADECDPLVAYNKSSRCPILKIKEFEKIKMYLNRKVN